MWRAKATIGKLNPEGGRIQSRLKAGGIKPRKGMKPKMNGSQTRAKGLGRKEPCQGQGLSRLGGIVG